VHIKQAHSVVGPLLFINGRICAGNEYLAKINSVKIALCGFVNSVISLNVDTISYNEADIVDITEDIKKCDSPIILTIGRKKHQINLYSKIKIDDKKLESIIEKWEQHLEQGLPIKKNYPEELDIAEKKYLDGFFNYYIACSACLPEDKRKRYADAFAILSEFNSMTPKARVLLKIIAFRLNWIERLETLCKTSKGAFDTVISFFKGERDEKIVLDKRENEHTIFVENGVAECLEAIMSFQEEDWIAVDKYINGFDDDKINAIKDINFKDRLLLLKARRMKQRGEYNLARRYYSEIKTPYLKAEADAFIKG
jgi:hypothetical protein